ncbi:MAG: hypothetical protein Kow0025_19500 [Thermodesulfovibrionales bacterium]
MVDRIIYRLRGVSIWYFVVPSVVFAEILTAVMSLILKGRVAYDYLLSGFTVTIIVASVVLSLIKRIIDTSMMQSASMEASLDGMAILNREGNFVYLNDAYARTIGISRADELIGKSWRSLYDEAEAGRFEAEIFPELREKGRWKGEAKGMRQDGTPYHQELSLSLIDNGRTVCVLRDISERKRMEERLIYNETYLRSVIEAEPECVKVVDEDGKILEINPAGLAMIEADSPSQVLGHSSYDIVKPEHREGFRRLIEGACKGKKGIMEFEITGLKGGKRWLESHAVPFYDERNGKPVALSVTRDATERRRSMEKISRLNRLYSTLAGINETIVRARDHEQLFAEACRIAVENGLFKMAWVGVVDTDTLLVKPVAHFGAEPAFLEDLRISVSDGVPEGRGPTGTAIRMGEYFVSNDIENDGSMSLWRDACLCQGYRSSAAFPLRAGEPVMGVITLYSTEPNFFREEEIRLLKEMATDISFALEFMEKDALRKQAEEDMLLAKQDWEETFNTITDMITVHDANYNFVRANRAAQKMLDIANAGSRKCFSLYHGTGSPPPSCPSCECRRTGKPTTSEVFEPHLNMYIEMRAIPRFNAKGEFTGIIHIARDITERKKSEEKFSNLLRDVMNAKNEWETTFDSVNELVVLVDKNFRIIRCNKSFSDFAGISIKQLAGHRCDEFLATPGSEAFDVCRESVSREEPLSRVEIETPSGHWFYISHRPILNDDGAYLYSVIVATDITALKNTERRIIESEEELRQRIDELEKFYDMAVGRELRMKELKKEIKRLSEELAQSRGNGSSS